MHKNSHGSNLDLLHNNQIREPFLWGEETVQDTHWMKPKYSIVPDVTPLQLQKDDPNSIYHYYKKWIQLRKEHPEISNSKLEFLKPASPNVLAYTLSGSIEKLLVIHNLSGQVSMVSIPGHSKIISDDKIIITDNKINVDPYSSVIVLVSSSEK